MPLGSKKPIKFVPHAEAKFEVLSRHEFSVTRDQVIQTLTDPDSISEGRKGRRVAQRGVDEGHAEESENDVSVVTFYPGRRSRY